MSDQLDHPPKQLSTSIVSVDDVSVGALLADKYRILRVLGHGGMGIVVEAEHARLGDHVAIKFLSLTHQGGEARERFEREARASVRLRSEHVARVRDIGELDTGQPYIVMDLLEGCDLSQYLENVTLEPIAIVDLALQCCEALAEAHALGIVHRDIKPANLFITHDMDRTVLKLLDFGVATGPVDDLQITSTGVVIGTPSYMCPEQMRSSRAAEPHWDLWSLGVVMYEMFEHCLPFVCDSFAELAVAVLTQPPRPMDHTPPALRAVIARCLDKHAAHRFLEAAELVEALAPHATPQQAHRTRARIARTAGAVVGMERQGLTGPTITAATATPKPPSSKTKVAPPPAPGGPRRAHSQPHSIDREIEHAIDNARVAESIRAEVPRGRHRVLVAATVGVVVVIAMIAVASITDSRDDAVPPDAAAQVEVVVDAPVAAAVEDAAVDAAPADLDAAPADLDAGIRGSARPDAARRDPPIPTPPADAAVAPRPPPDALSVDQLMKGRT